MVRTQFEVAKDLMNEVAELPDVTKEDIHEMLSFGSYVKQLARKLQQHVVATEVAAKPRLEFVEEMTKPKKEMVSNG